MRWTLAVVLGLCALPSLPAYSAGGGLTAPPEGLGSPSRWHARIEVDTAPVYGQWAGQPLGQASVIQMTRFLGDYHLDTLKLGQTSGLRLTSGVLLNPRSSVLGSDHRSAWPYLGIGYAGTGLKGDWGFSADVGLAAQNPGAMGQLGRAFNGDMGFGDALRELRLQPVVRLGVSYKF
jgi:hypothetical protein